MATINLYCDESCHLENDKIPIMVLGVVSCPKNRAGAVASDLRSIKERHGMGHGSPAAFEVKWSKVSMAGLSFYREYLDYFFDSPDLSFRAIVVNGKDKLRHAAFDQTHDDWYYKMFFRTLEPLIHRQHQYHVYLDIKDTLSQRKVDHLRRVLGNNVYDFDQKIVQRIQHVRSDEVEQTQVADLLIGVLGYRKRRLATNPGKLALVKHVQQRSSLTLDYATGRDRPKVNLFFWDAQEGHNA